ncbi:hypothetical protein IQ407_002466 [Listeria monocytogenes]|nr:hypothetical protein [Listeria monocytogenes]EGL4207615.1 hypothetical protein [Listeria monocytogenes]MBC1611722.1 hypothetical protein [Listeria welshimeri]MBC1652804.1 hypothetical protein [Listeria welshimeri]MBC1689275.1 hypothetical protein [Listeria welshimeri]
MQYEVHWEHTQTKEYNTHGKYATFEEALQSICDWWELNKYKPHYVRYWTRKGRTIVDYGSHHMFYYIYATGGAK